MYAVRIVCTSTCLSLRCSSPCCSPATPTSNVRAHQVTKALVPLFFLSIYLPFLSMQPSGHAPSPGAAFMLLSPHLVNIGLLSGTKRQRRGYMVSESSRDLFCCTSATVMPQSQCCLEGKTPGVRESCHEIALMSARTESQTKIAYVPPEKQGYTSVSTMLTTTGLYLGHTSLPSILSQVFPITCISFFRGMRGIIHKEASK